MLPVMKIEGKKKICKLVLSGIGEPFSQSPY